MQVQVECRSPRKPVATLPARSVRERSFRRLLHAPDDLIEEIGDRYASLTLEQGLRDQVLLNLFLRRRWTLSDAELWRVARTGREEAIATGIS